MVPSCSYVASGISANFSGGETISVQSVSYLDSYGSGQTAGPSPAFSDSVSFASWLNSHVKPNGGWVANVDSALFTDQVGVGFSQNQPISIVWQTSGSGGSTTTPFSQISGSCMDLTENFTATQTVQDPNGFQEDTIRDMYVTEFVLIFVISSIVLAATALKLMLTDG